jgi:hypothetical protein
MKRELAMSLLGARLRRVWKGRFAICRFLAHYWREDELTENAARGQLSARDVLRSPFTARGSHRACNGRQVGKGLGNET